MRKIPLIITVMQKKLLFLIFLMQLLLPSCVKNEFKVEFNLPPGVNTSYRLFYYASDKRTGWYMENLATIDKGKGTADCITRMPTLVYVYSLGSVYPSVVFYAERGDKIKIEGKSDDPLEWDIGGNNINRDLSQWRKENLRFLKERNSEKINGAVADYVRKHTDSEVSTILLLTVFDRRADEKGYNDLWAMLEGDATDDDLVRLIGRSDQLDPSTAEFHPVRAMKLYSPGDTLIAYDPRKYAATLFYFWRNGSSMRRETIDSLRKLTQSLDYKGRGMVVSMSFDTDTTSWLTSVRSDSLQSAVNAWCFAGEADSNIMDYGVPDTPYFIVADRKGRQTYRGSDYKSAAATFRKFLKPTAKTRK